MATSKNAVDALSGTPGRAIFRHAGHDADGFVRLLRLVLDGTMPGVP